MHNSRAKVFVTSARDAARILALRDRLPSLRQVVVVGAEVPGAVPYARLGTASPASPVAVNGDDVAMILYTSGTTGSPKGAMLTHAGLLDNASAVVEAVGFQTSDRSLCVLPLFHLFAIAFDYLQMMTAGGSTVIVERFDAEVTLRQIERHRVTVINIYPKEIENVLHDHPAVLECAVVGVPDPVKGEIPKACVVLREGASATEAGITEFCRQTLAAYKVPRLVEFMTSLPKTATGKVRKGELAAR